jgi:DNA helicase-2/ATP-dependent DNA helicase PcrA
VIQKLYPCRKTILGDIGQSVNPYGSSSAEMIQKAFAAAEIMYLHKSYRSTCEITHFAQTIRTDGHIEVVERHGDTPRVWQVGTEAEELGVIKELVAEFRSSQFESLGIICKDESRAWSLYEHLRAESDDVYILSHHNEAFVRGIVVTSAHMSKGLEFDEVIVPYADRRTYRTEMDRGMLYVAVTRALHRLSITCAGELTGFVSPLASEGANNERE